MRCSACRRQMRKPVLELAGAKFGPVCARKVLIAAGKLAPRKPRETETEVVRDTRTPDMFEGVAS